MRATSIEQAFVLGAIIPQAIDKKINLSKFAISSFRSASMAKKIDEEMTLAETAYRRLRRDIITGVRSPGEHLRVEYLRNIYSLGIGPIREALQHLAADGLVVQLSQKGYAVAPLTLEALWDLTEARKCLEIHALVGSIKHGDARWEASIVGLAYHLEKYDRMLMAGEDCLEEWEDSNRSFHDGLGSACPSKWVLKLRDQLYDQHERYRRASIRERMSGRNFAQEHIDIRDAVIARDVQRASLLLDQHIEMTARGFELWAKERGVVKSA